jgi:hypothetical protein
MGTQIKKKLYLYAKSKIRFLRLLVPKVENKYIATP